MSDEDGRVGMSRVVLVAVGGWEVCSLQRETRRLDVRDVDIGERRRSKDGRDE